jgi:alpha-galactosidase
VAALLRTVRAVAEVESFIGPGHWPDADMLPLGVLEMGKRKTHFTP